MRTGSLRHLITIQSYTETVDSFGGVTNTWAELIKAWASIMPLSGTEKYFSKEKHATATHQVKIRYFDGVNPKMRLLHGSRVFEIISVLNVGERDKQMVLIVQEDADV